MARKRGISWGRWAAVIAGALVAIRSAFYVVPRIFRIASGEVQARGKDEDFLLNLAAHRWKG